MSSILEPTEYLAPMMASDLPDEWQSQQPTTDHAFDTFDFDGTSTSVWTDRLYTYQKTAFAETAAQDTWASIPTSSALYHGHHKDSFLNADVSYIHGPLELEHDRVFSYYSETSHNSESSCFDSTSGTPSPMTSSFGTTEHTSSPLPIAPVLPSQHQSVTHYLDLDYGVSPADVERPFQQFQGTWDEDCSSFSPHVKVESSPSPQLSSPLYSSSTTVPIQSKVQALRPSSDRSARSSRKCQRSGTSKYNVIRSETIKEISCTWPGCTRRFSRREHLVRHRTRHTGERPEECPFNYIHPGHSHACRNKSRTDNSYDHYKCHVRAYILKAQHDVAGKLGRSTKTEGLSMAELQKGLLMIHGRQQSKLINKIMASIEERLRKDFDGTEFDTRLWSAEEHVLMED